MTSVFDLTQADIDLLKLCCRVVTAYARNHPGHDDRIDSTAAVIFAFVRLAVKERRSRPEDVTLENQEIFQAIQEMMEHP